MPNLIFVSNTVAEPADGSGRPGRHGQAGWRRQQVTAQAAEIGSFVFSHSFLRRMISHRCGHFIGSNASNPQGHRHHIGLIACLFAVWFCEAAQGQEPKRYALLIAVTEYQHAEMNKPRLAYPEIDAKDIGSFLEKHGYSVEYLLGSKSTKSAIEKKLAGLSAKGNQSGVVLIGLWGHGVEFDGSDEAMFCPYDASIQFATDSKGRKLFSKNGRTPLIEPKPSSLVGMGQVLGGLRLCGAGNRLLIADCCRNSPNRPRGRAFGSKLKLTDLPDNTAAIFACQANEQAFEDKRWGHGAMTRALLDLLPTMVSRNETSVTSILGPLKRDVARLVRDASQGRDRQTIHPIFNGIPDLRLDPGKMPATVTNRFGMEFRLVPAGEFMMGSGKSAAEIARLFESDAKYLKDEHPQHRVRLSGSYYLQTTELTQGQWKSVMSTEPWKGKNSVKEGANYPAVYVSWDDAVTFCRKLSAREGFEYRLPTEAEWEYACRGKSQSVFSFGDSMTDLGRYAWYDKNAWDIGEKYAHTVGSKLPNGFGLYDVHGNVYEWCSDWYSEDYYATSPLTDPQGPTGGSDRVYRGGGWGPSPRSCRSANRGRVTPSFRYNDLGFRVLRSSVK